VIIAADHLQIAQGQEYILARRPDPAQIEMTSGENARLLVPHDIIAAFRQNCRQPLDFFFLFTIVFKAGGEAVSARVVS
jgi:hypothetical protein